MMRDDLRRRLRELGVVKGVRELESRRPRRSLAIEDLVSGDFCTTPRGQCFVAQQSYPLDRVHGDLRLSSFLGLSPAVIAEVEGEDRFVDVDLRRVCFLDTETTGLSGGTGTMAFIVGMGFFADERFQMRQYFLRDPGDEPAMIEALMDRLSVFEALVSFNGRAFDVPIIENRFILARRMPPMRDMPHLDLLHPARRLWRYALSSCALTSLERQVLGVRRQQADVPSGVIPSLYRDYLRTGDARDMKRVLYHNEIDILSMVTLTTRVCRVFADPWSARHDGECRALSGEELYALGRWYASEGRLDEAEHAYRSALRLSSAVGSLLRRRTLREMAYLLKRDERRGDAFAFWQQLALESSKETESVLAYVELAKYFEWYVGDLSSATAWTKAALKRVAAWASKARQDDALADLRHRLSRLERKMAGQ